MSINQKPTSHETVGLLGQVLRTLCVLSFTQTAGALLHMQKVSRARWSHNKVFVITATISLFKKKKKQGKGQRVEPIRGLRRSRAVGGNWLNWWPAARDTLSNEVPNRGSVSKRASYTR